MIDNDKPTRFWRDQAKLSIFDQKTRVAWWTRTLFTVIASAGLVFVSGQAVKLPDAASLLFSFISGLAAFLAWLCIDMSYKGQTAGKDMRSQIEFLQKAMSNDDFKCRAVDALTKLDIELADLLRNTENQVTDPISAAMRECDSQEINAKRLIEAATVAIRNCNSKLARESLSVSEILESDCYCKTHGALTVLEVHGAINHRRITIEKREQLLKSSFN